MALPSAPVATVQLPLPSLAVQVMVWGAAIAKVAARPKSAKAPPTVLLIVCNIVCFSLCAGGYRGAGAKKVPASIPSWYSLRDSDAWRWGQAAVVCVNGAVIAPSFRDASHPCGMKRSWTPEPRRRQREGDLANVVILLPQTGVHQGFRDDGVARALPASDGSAFAESYRWCPGNIPGQWG